MDPGLLILLMFLATIFVFLLCVAFYNYYIPKTTVEIQPKCKCSCCLKKEIEFKYYKKDQNGDYISSDVSSTAKTESTSKNTEELQSNMHEAKAIALTCIDFRLVDDTVVQLNKLGYLNKYDEFILAGASLGYNTSVDNGWSGVFEEHINIAKDLHDIHEIIIIDHLSCGMYKNVYGELTSEQELDKHIENLKLAKETLSVKYPDFTISTYIIDIEGNSLTKYE